MLQAQKLSITSEQVVDDLLSLSIQNNNKSYAIFKHSTRCSISGMALNRMENSSFFELNELDFYYLDLISYRNVSNYIAKILGVEHESPQLLLIKNGKCIAHASHSDIRETWLKENAAK